MADQPFSFDSKERVALDLMDRITHTEPDTEIELDPEGTI